MRGELDALPIAEQTGVPWASVNGAMHACGHDVHLAAVVALARAIAATGARDAHASDGYAREAHAADVRARDVGA